MLLIFAASAMAQEATPKPRIICEHAAPPPGMRWVCKSQCDCHLEGKLKNDEDGVAAADAPKVCSYNAPKAGELLVCDSDCNCDPRKPVEQAEQTGSCRQPITLMVPPNYPPIAWTNAVQGVVFVQVEVADDGSAKSANVVEGNPLLREAAKRAVSDWRFDPTCNRVQMMSVRFRITQDEKNDPSGYRVHPPDEIEIVKQAPVVNYSRSAVSKKKPKKSKKPVPSK